MQHRLMLLLMAFWIGGLTAYAALVVPTGSALIGATDQGFVTRIIAYRFNILGAVATGMLLMLYGLRAPWRLRISCWLLGLMVISLWICHPWLDGLLDAKEGVVLDHDLFYGRHQVYLWLTTFQIVLGWLILWQLAGGVRGSQAE